MQLHHNNRIRLQVETLEDRITPASLNFTKIEMTHTPSNTFSDLLITSLAAPADQPAVSADLEKKDFNFGGAHSGTEQFSGAGAGKIKFNEFSINKKSEPVLAGYDMKECKPPVQTAVDAFIYFKAFEGMDEQEEPVLAGWDLKETGTKIAAWSWGASQVGTTASDNLARHSRSHK
jgi:hypothetical protein